MEKEEYIEALRVVYLNLVGEPWDNRPLSREFALKIAVYIEKILEGKTPKEISTEVINELSNENTEP
jgi:hypothetical protein